MSTIIVYNGIMTISEWLSNASKQIDRLDAELILQQFLEVDDRSYLAAHGDENLPDTSAIDNDRMPHRAFAPPGRRIKRRSRG